MENHAAASRPLHGGFSFHAASVLPSGSPPPCQCCHRGSKPGLHLPPQPCSAHQPWIIIAQLFIYPEPAAAGRKAGRLALRNRAPHPFRTSPFHLHPPACEFGTCDKTPQHSLVFQSWLQLRELVTAHSFPFLPWAGAGSTTHGTLFQALCCCPAPGTASILCTIRGQLQHPSSWQLLGPLLTDKGPEQWECFFAALPHSLSGDTEACSCPHVWLNHMGPSQAVGSSSLCPSPDLWVALKHPGVTDQLSHPSCRLATASLCWSFHPALQPNTWHQRGNPVPSASGHAGLSRAQGNPSQALEAVHLCRDK